MASIIKRLGKGGPVRSTGRKSCPDFLELDDGDIIVIGEDVTNEMKDKLALEASCADYEKIVKVPRDLFISLKGEIPEC